MLKTVLCPNCKKEVVWSEDSPYRPFCSKRCRIIDLGAWADGSYGIPTQESPDDEDDSSTKNKAFDESSDSSEHSDE